MKALLMPVTLLLVLAVQAKADLPRVCYATVEGGQFCTTDNLGKIQVFVYNAGWCPACNAELGELPGVASQFTGQPVVFASLSGEGWNRGERPDITFLQEWKLKHNIPFVVAGKYRDFGTAFNPPGYIPFTVIVDKQGNVTKSGSLSSSEISDEVRRLLGS
jgi:hypothetical protein